MANSSVGCRSTDSDSKSDLLTLSSMYESIDECLEEINSYDRASSRGSNLKSLNKRCIFSFAIPSKMKRLTYSLQKVLIAEAFLSNQWFNNGDLLETKEKGVLYPITHYREIDDESLERVYLLEKHALGKEHILYQAIYEEINKLTVPVIAFAEPDEPNTSAYIIIGFKTLEQTYNYVFEDNWQDLSGARNIYLSLSSDYGLSTIRFYRRIRPANWHTFVYLLHCKVCNVNKRNRVFLLDYVQRLRLRMIGYVSIYGHYFNQTDNSSCGTMSPVDNKISPVPIDI